MQVNTISSNMASTLKRSLNCNPFPEMSLNVGNNKAKNPTATIMARILIKKDSVINWVINDFFSDPNVFLTPTSLARSDDRAVDRFIKLIQAINNIKKATRPKIYKVVLFPFVLNSPSRCDVKYMSFRGCR